MVEVGIFFNMAKHRVQHDTASVARHQGRAARGAFGAIQGVTVGAAVGFN